MSARAIPFDEALRRFRDATAEHRVDDADEAPIDEPEADEDRR